MRFISSSPERLLAGIACAVVAAVALLTYRNIDEDRELTRASNVTAADALAISIAEHIEETLRDAANAVYSAAILVEERGGLAAASDRAWLHREFARELSDHTSIARMIVMDAGGRIQASSAEYPLREITVTDRGNFDWHWRNSDSRSFHLGITERSPVDNRLVIPYSRAIFGSDGRLSGMVVAEIDLERLRLFQQRVAGVYPSTLVVLNRDGARLFRFPFVESDLGRPVNAALPFEKLFIQPTKMEIKSDADGRTYLYSGRLTKDRALLVAVGRDSELALAEWRLRSRERVLIATLGSLVLLVLVGLLWRYLRRLERSESLLRENEARIRTVSDNLPDGMIYQLQQAPDGGKRFLYVSEAVERLHGLSAKAVEGNSDLLYDQVLDEDRHLMRAAEEESSRAQTLFSVVARIRRADGQVRFMRLTSAPHRLTDGSVRWDGIELDITDLKLANAALEASENRFRSAMLNSPVGMALLGFDGRWVEVNPALCVMLGYTREEMLARDFLSITHPDDADVGFDFVGRLLAGEIDSYEIEKRYLRKDRSPVWVQINASLARAPDGKPLHLVSQIQDITEKRQAADRIRQQNLDLEARVAERTGEITRVNEDLEAFSYSVAHDLRAPLHRIAGFAGLLGECIDSANKEAARDIEVIQREVERMGGMIVNLLSLARTSRTQLKLASIDLEKLVAEVRVGLTQEMIDRNIEWVVDLSTPIFADVELLHLVFENLLGNAVKYTRGKAPARIEVVTDREQSTAQSTVICVRDNGAGFDMRYASRLFKPFQRLHRASEFEGTGVGLANVQRIVQRHGGRIWAKAEPGLGAAFYLAFPVSHEGPGEVPAVFATH